MLGSLPQTNWSTVSETTETPDRWAGVAQVADSSVDEVTFLRKSGSQLRLQTQYRGLPESFLA